MADQDSNAPGNGAQTPNDAPQAATIAQYIKDLSVESPNAPKVFQWQAQPRLDVQFNLNVDRIGDDVHEVALKIEVAARSDEGIHFLIDLSYAGLFQLRNVPEDALAPFLLVEAPRLIFPFARQLIADATVNLGFPPLLLDPIDFGAAYMAQMQAQQAQQDQGALGTDSAGEEPAAADGEPKGGPASAD